MKARLFLWEFGVVDHFAPFELLKDKTKKKNQAVWSTGITFDILIKAQLHKTQKQAF